VDRIRLITSLYSMKYTKIDPEMISYITQRVIFQVNDHKYDAMRRIDIIYATRRDARPRRLN
jgi:hypothetical protein